jgi:hypothetical protein
MRANSLLVVTVFLMGVMVAVVRGEVTIVLPDNASPRVQFGAARLKQALSDARITETPLMNRGIRISIHKNADKPEGFTIQTTADGTMAIMGNDDSGALYGCLELARRIREAQAFPHIAQFTDAPAMSLRGTCIGMQKTYIIPGRKVYEYPYTPELFPFFYDKQFWQEYLDAMVENRTNTLYLWNGHPFGSLVRVPGFEYAVEVDDQTFQKNVEMMRYITQECDKRGIWLVQMFYSLIVSKTFAEKNGVDTQQADLRSQVSVDYTRASIAEFIKQYPHVGLLICLGEALRGEENQRVFLNEYVLPGVHDGMKQAGLTEEPPIIVRAHASNLPAFFDQSLKVYKNLYSMAKYNGESLTTHDVRGPWAAKCLKLASMAKFVSNVHILANLEPFRYGAQRFIQKSVQAARDRHGASGMHIYPLAYWAWPDSSDKADPLLKQWNRDWIWFEAWARYSWNPDIDAETDRRYWVGRLTEMYGNPQAAELILDAYNDSGECAPRIIRRFGITEGNRQTMMLGMYLDQLVNPQRYNEFRDLWESQAPEGERLNVYIDRELAGQTHVGETPPSIVKEILDYSAKAVEAIDRAAPLVTRNKEEFQRLRNDVHCVRAVSQNYAAKVNAAMHVLKYNKSKTPDVNDLAKAEQYLAESLEHYRTLEKLTRDTHRFANTMQTRQRRIPTTGGDDQNRPANYHWSQVLPLYEQELADFRAQLQGLKQGKPEVAGDEAIKPLTKASFKLISDHAQTYEVRQGATPFADRRYRILAIAPELVGLTGIRFSHEEAKNGRYVPIEFETDQPVQVLIGYLQDKRDLFLQPPSLETDASAANRSDLEPVILNAATIEETPGVNVHILKFPAGKHKLEMRGKGSFLVLGVIPETAPLVKRDANRKAGQ